MSHAAALSYKMGYAQPALNPKDILAELPTNMKNMNLALDSTVQVAINAPISSERPAVEAGPEKTVLAFLMNLSETGICFDVLLCETQLSVSTLQITLSQLKMNGWIKQKGALYYPA